MSVPKELEKLLIEAANQRDSAPVVVPDSILAMYSKDVNFEKAVLQLQMLPDVVKVYKQSQGLSKLEVTNIAVMKGVQMARDMFSEVDNLLCIYFTIPVTTCTAERSFSCLRCIKTYLRSSVTEERLNNIILLRIHKDETDQLNLQNIASMFVQVNDSRRLFLR